MKMIFDVETNGLTPTLSVLSFSAVLIDSTGEILEEIDRYYYPTENYSPGAIYVNGLTEETIKNNRKDAIYPNHFKDDKYITDLFNRVDEIIAHNIEFDTKFVEYHHNIDLSEIGQFCTMRETQYLYDAPYIHSATGEPKFPKLSEAVEYFGVDTSKIIEKGGYHCSLFDVYCTYEIYQKLMNE